MRTALLWISLACVLAAAGLHGKWTQRWGVSGELEAAVARIDRIPDGVEGWETLPAELDTESLKMAGAHGHWVHRFANAESGTVVTVILLCGQPGAMSIHRPEHCYRAAGYEMEAPQVPFTEELPGVPAVAFWTTTFLKPKADGAERLRIYWTWFAGTRWQAPGSPRLTFAGEPAMYKLYLIREIPLGADPAGSPAGPDGEMTTFIRRFLPPLSRALKAP